MGQKQKKKLFVYFPIGREIDEYQESFLGIRVIYSRKLIM